MIYPEDIEIGDLVIFVNDTDRKNYLVKIDSKKEFDRHQHLYPSSARFIVSHLYANQLFNEVNPMFSLYMFRGIELVGAVIACFASTGSAFTFKQDSLYFNNVLHAVQPVYLHEFQKIYSHQYGKALTITESKLKTYVDQLKYQQILNPHTNAYMEPQLQRSGLVKS